MWNGQDTDALPADEARAIAGSDATPENPACSAQAKVYVDAKLDIKVLLDNAKKPGRVGSEARELVSKLREQIKGE